MARENRWQSSDAPKGDDYDRRWRELAASGANVHGEVDCVEALLAQLGPPGAAAGARILDAGCGTGRVAIELARRGHRPVGIDQDEAMLGAAREKAPDLEWVAGDLAEVDLEPGAFDLVVMAGNVLVFVHPGTEAAVVANLAACLAPGGLLVSGWSTARGGPGPDEYDALAAAAGLAPVARYATWDRDPWSPGGDYLVAVHRRP